MGVEPPTPGEPPPVPNPAPALPPAPTGNATDEHADNPAAAAARTIPRNRVAIPLPILHRMGHLYHAAQATGRYLVNSARSIASAIF